MTTETDNMPMVTFVAEISKRIVSEVRTLTVEDTR